MNQKGQVVIELVVITAMTVVITAVIFQRIKRDEWMNKLVTGSWASVSGLLENGVWGSPEQTRSRHPGFLNRHLSTRDD